MKSRYTGPPFTAGDNVVLERGSYQGTTGVFLNLNADPNWADVLQWNGVVRNHPLAWLMHAPITSDRPVPERTPAP